MAVQTLSPETHIKSTQSWGRYVIILVAIVGFVMAAEGLAAMIYQHIEFATSYDAPRNPNFRRGWVEYTRPPATREPNERRIILISNSQGFLRERPEDEFVYASQLEMLLNQQADGSNYQVLNWSIPGGNAPEYILLAARAAAHDPDMILLVTYSQDFVEDLHPIAFYISDANRLGYLSDVRRYLPAEFIRQYAINDPLAWLEAHTYLGNMRNRLEIPQNDSWTWEAREKRDRPRGLHRFKEWIEQAEREMQFLNDTLLAALPDTPIVIVQTPINDLAFTQDSLNQAEQFIPRLQAHFESNPNVTILNASDIIAPETFYPDGVHFRPEGHRQFAEWLLPVVNNTLETISR
ncbi:MAG: SGNH/GDSL hydrolase family protein [Chloroflexi bacterium]|nr:MAG: SGNH/GDSL hydrolase family protein [Chloroflexota bacterium]